jgi:hypothetical protein
LQESLPPGALGELAPDRDMTFEEKRKLSAHIASVPGEKLSSVLDIIEECEVRIEAHLLCILFVYSFISPFGALLVVEAVLAGVLCVLRCSEIAWVWIVRRAHTSPACQGRS